MAVVPIIIVLLGTGAAIKVIKRKKGVMTPERKRIYAAALSGSLKSPEKLRTLAAVFRSEGLDEQAALLEKRAALKEAPADKKALRKGVFRKALSSQNKKAILNVAKEFHKIGATGAATRLEAYAAGLGANPAIQPPAAPDMGFEQEEVGQEVSAGTNFPTMAPNHGRVVCGKCHTILMQCPCKHHTHILSYADGCDNCPAEDTPEPIDAEFVPVEQEPINEVPALTESNESVITIQPEPTVEVLEVSAGTNSDVINTETSENG